MNLFNAILIGLKEVWAHKFRSLLTLFGVVLGVASLVGMSAIIKGMENGMRESMIAMGVVGVIVLGLLYWKFFMDTGPAPPPYYMPPPPPPAPAPAAGAGGADAGGEPKIFCNKFYAAV